MTALTLINGESVETLPVSDRGLHYGDGLFETIRNGQGQPVLWKAHLERLERSAARLGIPCDISKIEAESKAVINKAAEQGVLKILLSRGSGGRGYTPPESAQPTRIIQWHALPADLAHNASAGITVRLCKHPVSVNPALAGIKHLNRLDQVMASRELGPDEQEGLMLSPSGQLIEGCKSNLFIVLDGVLMTPDLSEAGVAGVMRDYIMAIRADAGRPVQQTTIRFEALLEASELFVCNSVLGIWPVNALYYLQESAQGSVQRSKHFQPGAVSRELQSVLRDTLGL